MNFQFAATFDKMPFMCTAETMTLEQNYMNIMKMSGLTMDQIKEKIAAEANASQIGMHIHMGKTCQDLGFNNSMVNPMTGKSTTEMDIKDMMHMQVSNWTKPTATLIML